MLRDCAELHVRREPPCLPRAAVRLQWAVRGEAGCFDESHGLLRTAVPVGPAAFLGPAARHAPAPAATVPSHGVTGRGREAHGCQTGRLLFVLGLGPHTASCLDLPAVCGWRNEKNDRDAAPAPAIAAAVAGVVAGYQWLPLLLLPLVLQPVVSPALAPAPFGSALLWSQSREQ